MARLPAQFGSCWAAATPSDIRKLTALRMSCTADKRRLDLRMQMMDWTCHVHALQLRVSKVILSGLEIIPLSQRQVHVHQ